MKRDVNGLQSVSSIRRRKGSQPVDLPVLDVGVVHERADAARNRLKVLAAAESLFEEHGVANVTMDDIAAEAGVGKGTLYRRFVDKGGLAVALLDELERELQQRILRGAPPLGPGAPAADRLAAFVSAYLRFLDRQLDLVLMSETATPGARLRTGAHEFWRQHCVLLLQETDAPAPDISAEVLLAALSAEQVRHWLREDQLSVPKITKAMSGLARGLAGSGR
ncbi:MAG: helix-turn-helix domain-containing protein [Actinomycetota bacterium]